MLTPINECVMEKQSNNCLSRMSLAQISHLHSRKIISSTLTLFISQAIYGASAVSLKEIVHLKMKFCRNCPHPQAI